MKKMKLFALCMASVLALSAALTGCGNGGSSSTPAGSSTGSSGSSTAPIDVSITTVDFGQSPDGTPIQEEWERLMAEKLGKPHQLYLVPLLHVRLPGKDSDRGLQR